MVRRISLVFGTVTGLLPWLLGLASFARRGYYESMEVFGMGTEGAA